MPMFNFNAENNSWTQKTDMQQKHGDFLIKKSSGYLRVLYEPHNTSSIYVSMYVAQKELPCKITTALIRNAS